MQAQRGRGIASVNNRHWLRARSLDGVLADCGSKADRSRELTTRHFSSASLNEFPRIRPYSDLVLSALISGDAKLDSLFVRCLSNCLL